jgi:murein L,D-transpeptidase YafK
VRRVVLSALLALLACLGGARAEQPAIHETAKPETAEASEAAPSPLAAEFEKKGLKLGAPVFLRILKDQSIIELWVSQGARYKLFKAYPICKYSGGLGPKVLEGDRQAPEGLYYIRASGLIVNRRWHRAMRINFPNSYDLANGRTGSGILIHGKCSSTGCFSLTDGQVEELYEGVEAALNAGQARVPVLSLPFPMTRKNLAFFEGAEWMPFWRELTQANKLFERDHIPPTALLCGEDYHFVNRRGLGRRRLADRPKHCRPLSKPLPPALVAAAAKPKRPSVIPVAAGLSPKEAAIEAAKTCDPRKVTCRLRRIALKSDVACPRKYARCRTPQAAVTKSVDCPLKYPRCRRSRAASARTGGERAKVVKAESAKAN